MGEKSAEELHHALIDSLRSRGVLYDQRVEAAFRAIPRHLFLPGLSLEDVYTDNAIAIKHDEDGMVVCRNGESRFLQPYSEFEALSLGGLNLSVAIKEITEKTE